MQCQPSKQIAFSEEIGLRLLSFVPTAINHASFINLLGCTYVLPDVYRVRHQIQNRQYGKILEKSATNNTAGFIQQISSEISR